MENNKLVIVDMVNGFVKYGNLADNRIMGIVDNIKRLVEEYHDIIVLEDCHNEGCEEFNSFPPHCVIGSKEEKTIDELMEVLPSNCIFVPKNSTNGFYQLAKHNLVDAKRYVLVGCCTDICVMQLALSLKTYANEQDNDTEVIVVSDACDTYDMDGHNRDEYHDKALSLMALAGVKIVTCADLLKGE